MLDNCFKDKCNDEERKRVIILFERLMFAGKGIGKRHLRYLWSER